MSHQLDRLFREKAEEATYPYKEEYKEEAASLWDRMDARERYRRWGLLAFILLLALISGLVWYVVDKESAPAASEPIAQYTESTQEDEAASNFSSPFRVFPFTSDGSGAQEAGGRAEAIGLVFEQFTRDQSGQNSPLDESSGSSQTILSDDRKQNPVALPPQLSLDAIEVAHLQSSRSEIDLSNALTASLPLIELSALNTNSPGGLQETQIEPKPREMLNRVGAGGMYSSGQSGLQASVSAALPVGRSFYAGMSLDLQRVTSYNVPSYQSQQVSYELGSVSEEYTVTFGPHYETNAQAWFGWSVNRHLLSLGGGVNRILALSSDWEVRRDEVSPSTEVKEGDLKQSEGRHWIDLQNVGWTPFLDLSYAYSITPRISVELSYRRLIDTQSGSDAIAMVQGESLYTSEVYQNGASESPNRFSLGIQYQINDR